MRRQIRYRGGIDVRRPSRRGCHRCSHHSVTIGIQAAQRQRLARCCSGTSFDRKVIRRVVIQIHHELLDELSADDPVDILSMPAWQHRHRQCQRHRLGKLFETNQ